MTKTSEKKRFTFADAKKRIKELENQLANTILDTKDNTFSDKELKRIRLMELLLPISALIIVILTAMLIF